MSSTAERDLLEEARILEILNQTGLALASKRLDLQAIINAVTEAATEVTGAQFGAFFYTVTNEAGEVFMLYALSGAPRELFENFGHPRSTPIFEPTFKGERVVRSRDITAEPHYGEWGPHFGMPKGHLPVRSYLAVPVVSRSGEVLGGLFFGHAETDVFTERSERLVASMATQAAMAIDNARLYDQAKRSAEERERLLTAEREARSALENANLLKDQFLATLSHELRTPLHAILGWTELLLARTDSKHDMRGALETIARNAKGQARLVDDLLDMNLIMSGRIRLSIDRVDIVGVVDAAVDTIRQSANAKSIAICKTLDTNVGLVTGDASRLQQVVWNLLSNAVKFTPKGGTVDVILQKANSNVEIVVHDSGCGISAEFLPHVFERFRQEDASSARRFGGLGLGLSIVKQLVELHGGSIRAESAGQGKGATFTIALPIRAVDQRVPPADTGSDPVVSARSAAALSMDGLKVLVVDDEPDALDLLRAVLESASAAEVVTALSADEAFALVKERRFDLILSDIGMPNRDGNQLMHDIRNLPPEEGGKTPATALTAFARSEDRTRAMLSGYQVHMSKPVNAVELLATIRSFMGNR